MIVEVAMPLSTVAVAVVVVVTVNAPGVGVAEAVPTVAPEYPFSEQ